MPRRLRIDVGGEVYHCLNRAIGRQRIFYTDKDYKSFEKILEETVEMTNMRMFAYCLMPNHFHLVLYPEHDGDLSDFMKRLTMTHTQRYRVATNTIGEGPIYQGRYKSFLIQSDTHLLTVLRYVERNPMAARLVTSPLDWKYSSLYRRYRGSEQDKQILSNWISEEPTDYINSLSNPLADKEQTKLEQSESKGVPFGDEQYIFLQVEKYGLQSVLHQRGGQKR